MANAQYEIRELRFCIQDTFTEVYVLLGPTSDGTLGVQGWHYKVFASTVPIIDIASKLFVEDHPVLWPQKAPEVP